VNYPFDSAFILENVNLFFGTVPILTDVNLAIRNTGITSIIGPSGSGKSTLLRTLNRLNDHYPTFRCTGSVRYRGNDIYANGNGSVDVARLRQDIGMVFQKPCLFPTSIYENVLFGLKRLKLRSRGEFPGIVETTLRHFLARTGKHIIDPTPLTDTSITEKYNGLRQSLGLFETMRHKDHGQASPKLSNKSFDRD